MTTLLAPNGGDGGDADVGVLPVDVLVNWPSCERRFSTMLISAMILMRLISPIAHGARELQDVLERTVDAEPDVDHVLRRLDVHVGGPVAHGLGEDAVDDLHDRRVLGDDRRAVGLGGLLLPRALHRLEGLDDLAHAADGLIAAVDGPPDVGHRAPATAGPCAR